MSNKDPQADSPDDLARELDSEPEEEATIVIQQPLYVEHQKGQGYSVRPRTDDGSTDDASVDEMEVTDRFDAGAVTEAYDMGSMTETIPADQFPAQFSDSVGIDEDPSPVTEALPSVAAEDVVVLIDDTESLPAHMAPTQGFTLDEAPSLSAADALPFSSAEDTPLLSSAPGTGDNDLTEMVTSEHLPELEDVEDIASLIEERAEGSLTAPSDATLEFQLPVEEIGDEKSPVTSVLWLVAAVLVVAAVVVFWRQSPETPGDGNVQVAQANTVTGGSVEQPDADTVDPVSAGVDTQFDTWVRGALAESLGQFVEQTENR